MDKKCGVTKLMLKRTCNEIIGLLMKGYVAQIIAAVITVVLLAGILRGLINKNSIHIIVSVVTSILSMLIIIFFVRGLQTKEEVFSVNKKMDFKLFLKILIVFIALAKIIFILVTIIGGILSLFGSEFEESINEVTGAHARTNIFLIINTGIIAPILEEIIFRGYILKSLKPYGKKFAIIFSSILFGMYHFNSAQLLTTVITGIIFGYVAMEYSIKISMILHIFNNLILAIGIPMLLDLELLPMEIGENIFAIFILITFILAIIILILHRKNIKDYCVEEKTEKGLYRSAILSPVFIIFFIIYIVRVIIL